MAPPPPEPRRLTPADEEVVKSLVERIGRQVLSEITAKNAEEESDPRRVNLP